MYAFSDIFMPLQGPGGVRPKAPAVGAWQSPSYKGLRSIEASDRYEESKHTQWFGQRTDGIVVVDCDCKEAAERWIEVAGLDTFIRKTPRGFHFCYGQTPGSPDGPFADVLGEGSHIDIRAGRTAQVAWWAPGYYVLSDKLIAPFDPDWLPGKLGGGSTSYEGESWDEMPEGRGNNTMAAFAGAFRKQGMSMYMIAKCLGAINAFTMPNDPMSNTEIALIAKSVSRYAPMPDIDIEVVDE